MMLIAGIAYIALVAIAYAAFVVGARHEDTYL